MNDLKTPWSLVQSPDAMEDHWSIYDCEGSLVCWATNSPVGRVKAMVDIVNACADFNPEAIPELVKAVKLWTENVTPLERPGKYEKILLDALAKVIKERK